MGEEVRAISRRARLRARPGPGGPLRPARAVARRARRGRAGDDQAARGDPRPRADRPPGAEEERAAPGLVVARPIRMRAQGGLAPAGSARHRRVRRHAGRGAPTRVRSTPTTACWAPSWPGELARARIFHPDTAPVASEDTLAHLHFNGGSVAGQGLGAVQRLRRGHPRRGRCAGRRGEDDARRQDLDHEGQEPRREAGQRLGRQVVRLRRPARAGCSCRATPTRASASASPAPTW